MYDNAKLLSAVDIPAAPSPGNITFSTLDLTFSWSSSSNSDCFSHYSINVTDGTSVTVITTTETSLTLPIPSTNDTEYSISVVTVDTGGRYREPLEEITFVASGKYSQHR